MPNHAMVLFFFHPFINLEWKQVKWHFPQIYIRNKHCRRFLNKRHESNFFQTSLISLLTLLVIICGIVDSGIINTILVLKFKKSDMV